MTRLWNVNPKILCRQHLLGEHSEMHQAAGTIANHPHGIAVVKGHAKKGNLDTSLISKRHDELAREMLRRGMNHDSELQSFEDPEIGEIDVDVNLADLLDRCEDCASRYEAL